MHRPLLIFKLPLSTLTTLIALDYKVALFMLQRYGQELSIDGGHNAK